MARGDGDTTRRATVLVVDDDPNVLLGVRVALETDGHRVVSAEDGRSALLAVAEHDPDAVVLDLAMPFLDGAAVCRTLRSAGDGVPVLVLTAHHRPAERVAGLDAGAGTRAGAWPRWRGVVLDEKGQRLVREDATCTAEGTPATVELTRIEAGLAGLLFRDPGRVRTRDELVDVVWADRPPPASNALDVAVSSLRRKLAELVREPPDGQPEGTADGRPDGAADASAARPVVRAVRGLGYRLEP